MISKIATFILLLMLASSTQAGTEKDSADTINWIIKTAPFRYLSGDFAVNLEHRIIENHTVDIGIGITNPNSAWYRDIFQYSYEDKSGVSLQGSWRIYRKTHQKLKGFSIEAMYRYQIYKGDVVAFNYQSDLSQKGSNAQYHHFNAIGSYQFMVSNFVGRIYCGLGLFQKVRREVKEVETWQINPETNAIINTVQHQIEKEVKQYPSIKFGIELGIGW